MGNRKPPVLPEPVYRSLVSDMKFWHDATTHLRAGHQVTVVGDDGDRILLDGGRRRVVRHSDILQKNGVQGRVGKLEYGLGDASARGLNGDVVVLLEVDTGLLLGHIADVTEELLLEAGVATARNVLAVAPCAEADGAAALTAAAAATGPVLGRGATRPGEGAIVVERRRPVPTGSETTTG